MGLDAPRVDAGSLGGRVEDRGDHWLVRDAVAWRAGVTLKGELKTPDAVRDSVKLFENAPWVWQHPGPEKAMADGVDLHEQGKLQAAGRVVNPRHDSSRNAVAYDLILFKQRPPGMHTSAEDLERNARAVDVIRAGGSINNSPGYRAVIVPASGVGPGVDGVQRSYHEVQPRITRVGHVAGLAPIAGLRGACPAPACGAGRTDDSQETTMDPPRQQAQQPTVIFQVVPRRDDERQEQEKTRMDSTEIEKVLAQARTDAEKTAQKVVEAAVAPVKARMDESCQKLDSVLKAVEGVRADSEQRQKTDQARVDAELDAAALRAAKARLGARTDEAKLKEESKRLRGLFPTKPALDEYTATLTAPGLVDPNLVHGQPVREEGAYGMSANGTWQVRDWSKVPAVTPQNRGFPRGSVLGRPN